MKVVAFRTAAREEWISPDANPPGEPLARALRDRLMDGGVECDEVDLHEEYGWAWLQRVDGVSFYVLLIQYAGLADQWVLQVSAQRRFPFLTRPNRPDAESKVCQQIQDVLAALDGIDNVRWFDALSDVATDTGGRSAP